MINLSTVYTSPSETPRFELGEVIFHKRYAYRGVIVSIDPDCQAPDELVSEIKHNRIVISRGYHA